MVHLLIDGAVPVQENSVHPIEDSPRYRIFLCLLTQVLLPAHRVWSRLTAEDLFLRKQNARPSKPPTLATTPSSRSQRVREKWSMSSPGWLAPRSRLIRPSGVESTR